MKGPTPLPGFATLPPALTLVLVGTAGLLLVAILLGDRVRFLMRWWVLAGAGAVVIPLLDVLRHRVLFTPLALMLAAVLFAARLVIHRQPPASRVRFLVLPSPDFKPTEAAIERFARLLSGTSQGSWMPGRSAVRITLGSTPDGELRYELEAGARQRAAILTALGAYDEVEVRELEEESGQRPAPLPDQHVAHAELVLAGPASDPLADLGPDPDPLQPFARGAARVGEGEVVHAVLDLMPAHPSQQRRLHHLLASQAARFEPDFDRTRNRSLSRGVMAAQHSRKLGAKLDLTSPLFEVQVLIEAWADTPERAEELVSDYEACFRQWRGANHWRRTRGFASSRQRRLATGAFAPRKRNLVNARELAGLLKPPTIFCAALNIAHAEAGGGPIPKGLPDWSPKKDVLPLGFGGYGRTLGITRPSVQSALIIGESGSGKSTTANNWCIHLALHGFGYGFMDPHGTAVNEQMEYLGTPELRDRVHLIDLTDSDETTPQPAWNIVTSGYDPAHPGAKVRALRNALAGGAQWSDSARRLLVVSKQIARSLVELIPLLPPEVAPTIFLIPTLLSNEEWRQRVIPYFSRSLRAYWRDRYPLVAKDVIPSASQLIDEMWESPAVMALLGNSVSTFDPREVMDNGGILLIKPGTDYVVSNLIVHDLVRCALSRPDPRKDPKPPWYLFLDELPVYDRVLKRQTAAILRQGRKFGFPLIGMSQDFDLSEVTLQAFSNNRSVQLTGRVGDKHARIAAAQWGGDPSAAEVVTLPKHRLLAAVVLEDSRPKPFAVRTIPTQQLWREAHHPELVPDLEQTLRERAGARSPAEVEAHIETLDERILAALEQVEPPDPEPTKKHFGPMGPATGDLVLDDPAPAGGNGSHGSERTTG
jgi:hypothetical protein